MNILKKMLLLGCEMEDYSERQNQVNIMVFCEVLERQLMESITISQN